MNYQSLPRRMNASYVVDHEWESSLCVSRLFREYICMRICEVQCTIKGRLFTIDYLYVLFVGDCVKREAVSELLSERWLSSVQSSTELLPMTLLFNNELNRESISRSEVIMDGGTVVCSINR
jgi:hypothetical protein